MSETIVFLDRATLPTRSLKFDFPHQYCEYDITNANEIATRIASASIVITNKVVIGEAELATAPNVKLIAVCATGYNNIDLAACEARGVSVCNVRAYGNDSVAEHALMLMLALMRALPAYTRDVAAGFWQNHHIFAILAHRFVISMAKPWLFLDVVTSGKRLDNMLKLWV